DKSEISGFVADKFSHAGASHILAVSGLHVVGMSGLFYVLLIRLLSLFPLANVRWIAIISACVFAYTMVLVTEGPIGAMRAFTGMVVISLISLSGRRPNPIEILALVASLILLPTPTRWTHVGFQLSFISVWSIITFTQVNHRWLTPLSVSWWTTISTAPLLVYHFGTLSPGGILTNLILVPFVTLILMPTAWIGLCFYSFSEAPLKLASELSQFFLCVLDQLYALGSKMWILGTHNAPFVLMISMAFMLRQFPIRWRALTMLFAVIVPLIKQTDAVHFMSVGQGDATLILSHDQSAMLDAGPAFHGERLLRGLRRLGVKTLNLVSISHQHPDHFAGLEALVGRIPIKTLLTPKQPRTNQALIDLEQRLKRHGTQTIQVETQPLFVGEFTLIPYPANPALYRTENDASLAFLVHHRYGSVMVMGDLEQRGEANLLAKAPPKVDVIRAGHHGSRTSTHHSLLNRLCPKHVVLSLGHENQFGFPHKEVVRRIERHASSLWRTDIDGRITIELSPNPKIYGQHQSAQALKNIEKRQPCGQYPPNKPSLNL
ncbi:MAG: DNA internalization-related competence protein ComEC/Rec2, partial [Bradymonadia bacterium]